MKARSRMRTYNQLCQELLRRAGVKDHFHFLRLSPAHDALWQLIKSAEMQDYRKKYGQDAPERRDTPPLGDSPILTASAYRYWLAEYEALTV